MPDPAPQVPGQGSGTSPARLVVLLSGTGTLLQALLDACADPAYGATVVAVGSDRPGIAGLERAEAAGVETFVNPLVDRADRPAWDEGLAAQVAAYEPHLVVSAGFMKLAGAAFLERFGGRYINTHPALLPAFPGMHGARDALEYGVKVAGCTVFVVDAGVDTGPILTQAPVMISDSDDEVTLHERIKSVERVLLVQVVAKFVTKGVVSDGRKARFS